MHVTWQVGPRLNKDRERFPPNNILLMLAGAGLLWMGWTGFNGGDPYSVSMDASLAVLNTHACTATSLLTWVLLDVMFFRKPSVIGAVQGMITGLVCITPAAGLFVNLSGMHYARITSQVQRIMRTNFWNKHMMVIPCTYFSFDAFIFKQKMLENLKL